METNKRKTLPTHTMPTSSQLLPTAQTMSSLVMKTLTTEASKRAELNWRDPLVLTRLSTMNLLLGHHQANIELEGDWMAELKCYEKNVILLSGASALDVTFGESGTSMGWNDQLMNDRQLFSVLNSNHYSLQIRPVRLSEFEMNQSKVVMPLCPMEAVGQWKRPSSPWCCLPMLVVGLRSCGFSNYRHVLTVKIRLNVSKWHNTNTHLYLLISNFPLPTDTSNTAPCSLCLTRHSFHAFFF